jgi:hypothetical protein
MRKLIVDSLKIEREYTPLVSKRVRKLLIPRELRLVVGARVRKSLKEKKLELRYRSYVSCGGSGGWESRPMLPDEYCSCQGEVRSLTDISGRSPRGNRKSRSRLLFDTKGKKGFD